MNGVHCVVRRSAKVSVRTTVTRKIGKETFVLWFNFVFEKCDLLRFGVQGIEIVTELIPLALGYEPGALAVEEKNRLEVLLDRLMCRPQKLLPKSHAVIRAGRNVVAVGLFSKYVGGKRIENDL